MKKIVLVIGILLLAGCTDKLSCRRDGMKYIVYDSEEVINGKNIINYEFKEDKVVKIETIIDFKDDYSKEICNIYKEQENVKCKGTKIISESKNVSEYKDMNKEEIKEYMKEEGYTCK